MPVSARGSRPPLIEALLEGDDIARETAAARLAIRGNAAVRTLIDALQTAAPDGQIRILGLLERIGAPSAQAPVSRLLLDDNADVAVAAANTLAIYVLATEERVATKAVDALTTLVLDTTRDERVRAAALDALAPLDETATAPLRMRLASDSSQLIRTKASGQAANRSEAAPRPTDRARLIDQAADGVLPGDPEALRRHLARAGGLVPLTTLHRLIVTLREREAAESDDERCAGWLRCRATTHQALASRGSRLAVYDLRETIEHLDGRVPVGFLAALTEVGDASCLTTLAIAWSATNDTWFRQQLESSFRTIVARERITKRHAAVRRMASQWPEAFQAMWEGQRGKGAEGAEGAKGLRG